MAEGAVSKLQVLAAVSKLASSLQQMVRDGRANYEHSGDINDFVKSHGEKELHGLLTVYPVQLYAECFRSLGIKSRKELEALWNQHSQDAEMKESVAELLLAEEQYRAFMEELDQIMNKHEEKTALPVAKLGGKLSTGGVELVDGSTGNAVSLDGLLQKSNRTLFILRKHYV